MKFHYFIKNIYYIISIKKLHKFFGELFEGVYLFVVPFPGESFFKKFILAKY